MGKPPPLEPKANALCPNTIEMNEIPPDIREFLQPGDEEGAILDLCCVIRKGMSLLIFTVYHITSSRVTQMTQDSKLSPGQRGKYN